MSVKNEQSRTVAAVMLQKASSHPWGSDLWSLVGLIPGLNVAQLSELEQQGRLHHWPDMTLTLHPLHCDAYYQNLMSGNPQVYVVSQSMEGEIPEPLLITMDYDEAASYMETGEQVFYTTLPLTLVTWVEAFVLEHYQPEKPKKRQRKNWHQDDS
jgi:hypothetical protein